MNSADTSSRYIELLRDVLTDWHRIELAEYRPLRHTPKPNVKRRMLLWLDRGLQRCGYTICTKIESNPANRIGGRDRPARAETMIGLTRMKNIQRCVAEVLKNNIPGDLLEAGVWRGGATIFMKALLDDANDHHRVVWVADSFEGLPRPDAHKYPADADDRHFTKTELAISLETVRRNFEKYHLLDDNVRFLKGWFKDTLSSAPIEHLAILRLDGDMYESTMDALIPLYPKLSVGGYVIVDDWGAVPACKKAVEDYRRAHQITEEIKTVDESGVYWRKER